MLSSAVEHGIADPAVTGSIPAVPFFSLKILNINSSENGTSNQTMRSVPVAQLDKASDYESEDWGFKSLQG